MEDTQPGDHTRYDWFPNLSLDRKASLLSLVTQEIQQRAQAPDEASTNESVSDKLAAAWLQRVLSGQNFNTRLQYMHYARPTVGQVPSYEDTLVYGVASDSLESDEFLAYVNAAEYNYWADTQHQHDAVAAMQLLWSLPEELRSTLAPLFFEHILRNTIGFSNLIAESQDNIPVTSESTTILQQITDNKIRVRRTGDLGMYSGFLLTGPRVATMILGEQEFAESEEIVAAHLLIHYLLSHIDRTRISVWKEYQPGATPDECKRSLDHWFAEEEADRYAVCLLEPLVRSKSLTPQGRRLVAAFFELGADSKVVRLILTLREKRFLSPMSMLRTSRLEGVNFARQLVVGTDRHVYFIDERLRRRWVCSKDLLYACARDRKEILQVSDTILKGFVDGPPIYSMQDAKECGLDKSVHLSEGEESLPGEPTRSSQPSETMSKEIPETNRV